MSAAARPAEEQEKALREVADRLRQEKQRLSLDAVSGDKKARAALKSIVAELAEVESELELLGLAEGERQRRAEEERIEKMRIERLAKLEQLKVARATEKEKLDALQLLIDALLGPIAEVDRVAREVYQLASDLNMNPRWNMREQISNRMRSTIGPALGWRGFDYVGPRYRQGSAAVPPHEGPAMILCEGCGSNYRENVTHNCEATFDYTEGRQKTKAPGSTNRNDGAGVGTALLPRAGFGDPDSEIVLLPDPVPARVEG